MCVKLTVCLYITGLRASKHHGGHSDFVGAFRSQGTLSDQAIVSINHKAMCSMGDRDAGCPCDDH